MGAATWLSACVPNPAFDGPADASGGEQGDSGGDCSPRVRVSGLHAAWSTPNQIRWAWAVDAGTTDTLQEFRLELGADAAALLRGDAAVRSVTRSDNPELGFLALPGTTGDDPVRATVVDGLNPDTDYAARLLAIDDFGCTSTTAVAFERTPPPPVADDVVFADVLSGYTLPHNLVVVDDPTRAYGGTSFLEYRPQDDPECAGVTPVCWQNLRLQDLALPLSLGTAFDKGAYVEFALAADTANTPYWANAWLRFDTVCDACGGTCAESQACAPDGTPCDAGACDGCGPCSASSCPSCSGYYEAWTVRPAADYRVVQWPLRAFLRDGASIPAAEADSGLFGFAIGTAWDPQAVIRIDEIHVRH